MRLTSIRIRSFRCIEDSEEFSVSDVTCLVGKNESGKTTILKALAKLNPVLTDESGFTPLDYPRRKWVPNMAIPSDPPAIQTKWTLTNEDHEVLAHKSVPGVVRGNEVVVSKSYDNVVRVEVDINERAVVDSLISEANLSAQDLATIGDTHETLSSMSEALSGIEAPTERHNELKARVSATYPKGVVSVVRETIMGLLPKFVYFDDYHTLPGQVSLEDFLARRDRNELTKGEQVFQALLELAGTTPEQIRGLDKFEELNAALRAVSNNISEQVFEYWTQNRYLEAVLKLDAARNGDPVPFNKGNVFRTRIDNRRHKADTSFDERSAGFVWFFSFLVWFSQLQHRLGNRLVVLLDEPGLTLHARAQADLLRYINEKLKPGYQVLYTTHSPFMIDADNLLSARTVEDVDKDGKVIGTKVGDQILSRDPDTISPLQRALDYEITQTLFVGRNTLLVEGASDLVYLKWFSSQLVSAGRKGLDYRWAICHVGGVDRIPGFVSLFRGNNLNVVALVDYATGQKQKAEQAAKRLPDKHLLRADTFAQQAEADTEDILGREFYVALVNATYELPKSQEVPTAKPPDSPQRVVKEVGNHMATVTAIVPEYDHYAPAKWLFDHPDKGVALSGFQDAMNRMETLIVAINAFIE